MNDPVSTRRLEDLLSDRTGGCLPHEERREFERLLAEHPSVDPHEFDEAAGALMLAFTADTRVEPLPNSVRRRLEASADAWFAGLPAEVTADSPPPRGRLLAGPWTGWAAAAAATLFAVGVWVSDPGGTAPPAAEERQALLSRVDTGYWEFAATDDPLAAGADGDVVWSSEEQRGYMRFQGLPANDPTEAQYQLWIFDSAREGDSAEETVPPVDGGVFDVGGDGEVIVPIDPKLSVGEPKLFAITLEPPGGVVVSKQEHVLLVASTSG